MRRSLSLLSVLPVLPVLAVLFTNSAQAQATRTWVSGVGDDANPCSRTAPCKTFAGAISKTATGGEINTLDPGGFGAVTITKSITISNEGTGEGGVLVSGTNGIVVNLGTTGGVVTIRGLIFDGVGTGLAGITWLGGPGTLNVERCQIFQFAATATTAAGINFQPTGAATLNVMDTGIYNNPGGSSLGGILIQPQSGGSATGFLNRVRVYGNTGNGIKIDGSVTGAGASSFTIRDSEFNNNSAMGVEAISQAAAINVMVDNAVISDNGTFGLRALGASATIRLTNSTITGNATGINAAASGMLISFGNNSLAGNATDGAPSSTITTK